MNIYTEKVFSDSHSKSRRTMWKTSVRAVFVHQHYAVMPRSPVSRIPREPLSGLCAIFHENHFAEKRLSNIAC